MGVKFLSDEWTSAMTAALNADDTFKGAAAGQEAKLQQVVTDTPDGAEAKYNFVLEGGAATVSPGEMEGADATITQTYETAVAVNKGELNAQQAFMQGKLKISGNMMKLMQLQSVFNTMGDAVKSVEVDY